MAVALNFILIKSFLLKALAFVFVLGTVVMIHEFGHFIVAVKNDIEVKEFMIGFGPKLFKIQGKETEYSIRLIPLGGAVVMTGENEYDESERSFTNKPIWRRLLVLFAGPFMNFVLAIVIFTFLFLHLGFPSTKVTALQDNMPAKEAGIEVGDIIKKIDGIDINTWKEVIDAISESKGDTINVEYERKGELLNTSLRAEKDAESNRYIVGIMSSEKKPLKSFSAACKETWNISYQTLVFLPKMITERQMREQVSGPVGIAVVVGKQAEQGMFSLFALMAVISISLGVFNLLPIVPLDGGKIFLYLIELIIRKPLNEKFQNLVSIMGIGLVLFLFIFATYNDILKIITNKI